MTHFRSWFRAAAGALASGALWLAACSDSGGGTAGTYDSGSTGSLTDGTTGTSGSADTTTSGGSVGGTSGTTVGSASGTTTGTGTGTTTTSDASSTTTGSGGAGTTTSGDGASSTTTTGSGGVSTTTGSDTGDSTTTGSGATGSGATGTGGTADASSTTAATTGGDGDDINSGPDTMGWIGCSMGENTATGYRRIGGTRMWGPYGNGGAVVQNWTNDTGADWGRFDNQVAQYGTPKAVWIMICIFPTGATIEEIRQMVANTREHAPGAYLYITGQPLYVEGQVCSLAGGEGGPESTDALAQQMADEDPDVHYAGTFGPLGPGTVNAGDSTGCHASQEGEDLLGQQAKDKWGQP